MDRSSWELLETELFDELYIYIYKLCISYVMLINVIYQLCSKFRSPVAWTVHLVVFLAQLQTTWRNTSGETAWVIHPGATAQKQRLDWSNESLEGSETIWNHLKPSKTSQFGGQEFSKNQPTDIFNCSSVEGFNNQKKTLRNFARGVMQAPVDVALVIPWNVVKAMPFAPSPSHHRHHHMFTIPSQSGGKNDIVLTTLKPIISH